jgi:methylated-DNA-protein-cysteine methyltransferase-like protein
MPAYHTIYQIVRQIPYGKVATYGQIARLAQMPNQARLVGYALYRIDRQFSDIPWHRVVNSKGEISYSSLRNGTDYLQRSLLEKEEIVFNHKGKINLHQYQWKTNNLGYKVI